MKTRLPLALAAVSALLASVGLHAQTADSFDPNPDGSVYCAVPQSDGRVLLGGNFGALSGESHLRVGRVNTNGTPDSAFNPRTGGMYPDAYSFAEQLDGRILVSGEFSDLNGQARQSIGRLEADGALDTAFNPAPRPRAALLRIQHIAVQPDGKILVAGDFDRIAGVGRANLARLLPSGEIDPSFSLHSIGPVGAFALQDDGKIIVSGVFTFPSVACTNIVRLHTDGAVDTNFHAATTGHAACMAVQADGKILLGGYWNLFSQYGGAGLGRLNPDGSTDTAFLPAMSSSGFIYSIAPQVNGKMIVGGGFTSLAGNACTNIGRLTASGAFDSTFNPGANGQIDTLVLQRDGRLLVNGPFTTLGGGPRSHIGRLNNPDAASENLSIEGSRAVWLRDGSGPELYGVTFESSPDGSAWSSIGTGRRIPGGWESVNMVPAGHTVRARGHALVGGYNTSSYLAPSTTTAGSLDLLANGSFEFGNYVADPNARWMNQAEGSTNIAGWLVSAGGANAADWHDTNQFDGVREGGYCLDLNTAGVVEQELTDLEPGLYQVSFWMIAPATTGRGGPDWPNVILQAEFGDAQIVIDRETHDFQASRVHWRRYTFPANVTGGSATLRFSSLLGNMWGPVIDNVSVKKLVPIQVSGPGNRSAIEGDTISLNVTASSALPLSYQWQKDGADLANDLKFSGVNTASLTISNLMSEDAGAYSVQIWNEAAVVNSTTGMLQIITNVAFADPALEQAVRDELGIPSDPLTPADLAGLITLDASARGITNLSGLEAAARLASLNLSENPAITVFAPLEYLGALTNLAVNNAELDDLEWAAGLIQLASLQVNANFIQDLSPLTNLIHLAAFSITENELTAIDPLNTLPALAGEINLGWNRLDTNSTSAAWAVITNLTARGATVNYDPQRDAPAPPVITVEPASIAAYLGDEVVFSVEASGDPLFRWKKNGATIFNGGTISGAQDAALTISGVEPSDAGAYRLRAWNDNGVTLSRVATLRVITNIAFTDPNLERAVRDRLGIPSAPLTPADAAGVDWLEAGGYGVTNLSGIESLANLAGLDIADNPSAEGLENLTLLPKLRFLSLNNCGVSNIAFASRLASMEELHAHGCDIRDISPLTVHTNLRVLNLAYCPVTNAHLLAGLPGLEHLSVEGVGLTNIAFVTNTPLLISLNIGENTVGDLAPLAGRTALTWLNINCNPVTNAAVLGGLTNLGELHASHVGFSNNLGFLATLTRLEVLVLTHNGISSLPAYPHLNQLRNLNLEGNPLTGIAFVAGMTNLIDLVLADTGIRDLGALSGLTNLINLNVTGNGITDISPLATLPQLRWITLWNNQLRDIAALTVMTNLNYADLRLNLVDCFGPNPQLAVIQTLQGRGANVEYNPQQAGAIFLLSPARTGGQFQFTLHSAPNSVVQVWSSTNLVNWPSAGFVTNATGTAFVTNGAMGEKQFYRATPQNP